VEALSSRRFDGLKLLVSYIDGLAFGDYTMIGAVGVDSEGNKHVLDYLPRTSGSQKKRRTCNSMPTGMPFQGKSPSRRLYQL
jgi:hypothetical protein